MRAGFEQSFGKQSHLHLENQIRNSASKDCLLVQLRGSYARCIHVCMVSLYQQIRKASSLCRLFYPVYSSYFWCWSLQDLAVSTSSANHCELCQFWAEYRYNCSTSALICRLARHQAQVNFLVQSPSLTSGMSTSEDWPLQCEHPMRGDRQGHKLTTLHAGTTLSSLSESHLVYSSAVTSPTILDGATVS